MALNLGEINFGLGVDTSALERAITSMQRFGTRLDNLSSRAEGSSSKVAAAFMKQERSMVAATQRVLALNDAFRKIDGGQQFVDQANSALTRYIGTLSSGQIKTLTFQRAQEALNVSLANASRGFNQLKSATPNTISPIQRLNESMKQLAATVVLINGPLGGFASRVTALSHLTKSSGMAMAAFAAGLAVGATGFMHIAKQSINASRTFEGYRQALNTAFQSQEEGNKALEYTIDLARRSGQSLKSVVPSYAKFAAATKGTSLEGKETAEIFETVTLAAAKLNLESEQTEGALKAIEQMMSKGTVQAEELRGQLGDRLPGAFRLASEAMGPTTKELGDLMKKGGLVSEEFLPKFKKRLQEAYGVKIGGNIDTFNTSLQNMQTASEQFFKKFDEVFGISNKVKAGIDLIIKGLDFLRTNMDNLKPVIDGVGIALSLVIGATALGGVMKLGQLWLWMLTPIAQVGSALLTLGTIVTTTIIPSLAQAVVASTRFLAVLSIQALTAATGAVTMLARSFAGLAIALWSNPLVLLIGAIVIAIIGLGIIIYKYRKEISEGWDAIVKSFQMAKDGIVNYISGMYNDIKEWLGDKLTAIFDTVKSGVESVKQSFYDLWNAVTKNSYVPDMVSDIIREFTTMSNGMQDLAGKATGAVDKQFRDLTPKVTASVLKIDEAISKLEKENNALKAGESIEKLNEAFAQADAIKQYVTEMRDAGRSTDEIRSKIEYLQQSLGENKVLKEQSKLAENASSEWIGALTNGIDEAISKMSDALLKGQLNMKTFSNILSDIAGDILKTFLKLSVSNPLKNMIFGGMNGYTTLPTMLSPGGGTGGGMLGNIFGTLFGRKGLAFDSGVRKFRKGGLLNKPTMFAAAGGPVIGGEAGTEAIMPLKRMANGSLGVSAEHGNGTSVGMGVNVNIQNYGQTQPQVNQRNNGTIDIIIPAIEGQIAGRMARGKGSLAKANNGSTLRG